MKNTFKYLAICAAAAFLATGCQIKERSLKGSQASCNTVTVRFSVSGNDSKAAFGQYDEATGMYPAYWTASDTEICMSLNMNDPVVGEVVKTEEVSATAEFIGKFEDTGAPYKFYALSPTGVVNGISESRSSWSVSIPAVQTPKADGLSCDEKAMLLFAESDELQSIPEGSVNMHLRHVNAYCRLALKNLDAAFASFGISDASVYSVDLSFSVPVTGDFFINVTDGSLEEKDPSHTITIRTGIADLSQPTDLWFALAPTVLDGQKVKVTVNTDKGRVSREYTYGERTYFAGTVNKLSLDMTKGSKFDPSSYEVDETVYELVTDLTALKANDVVLIADDVNPSTVMSKTLTSGVYGAAVKDAADGFSYSEKDGYIRLPEGSAAMQWTIASKSSSNGVKFKNGSNYLATSGSGSSVVFTTTTRSNSAKTFTLYDFGEGELAAYYSARSGSYTYYYSINPNADGFNIYTDTSGEGQVASISLFKKKDVHTTYGKDLDTAPILNETVYGAYLQDGSILYMPGTTQLSREYGENSVTFAIISPSTNAITEMAGIPVDAVKGDTFDLVINRRNGRKLISSKTCNVTVVMEEGPKVWLSDFAGNSFIVKR